MGKSFVKLGHNKSLKYRPFHCVGRDIVGLSNSEKITQKAGIQEIELWALDEPFGKVGVVWREQVNDKTRLKDRDPVPGRCMRDPAIGR